MTNLGVSAILAQIALVEREIINPATGWNVVAYDNVPYTIATADMPLFVNFAGALTENRLIGSDEKGREFIERRNYSLVLYKAPYGSGVEGEHLDSLTPFFDLVYEKFGSYPHLKGLAGTVDCLLTADSGAGVFNFSDRQFYGVRFNAQVTSRVRRLLANGE